MSKKLFKEILKEYRPDLEIITVHKDYITIANKDRTYMKHYQIKE